MATFAARRLGDMAENTANVLAIELLAACQGVDFRAPLKTSKRLESAKDMVRALVPFYDQDRYFSPDIKEIYTLIQNGGMNSLVERSLLPSF